jgi:hypothetical protein
MSLFSNMFLCCFFLFWLNAQGGAFYNTTTLLFFFLSQCRKGALECHPPFFLPSLAILSTCNILCVVCGTKILSPWSVGGWCCKLRVLHRSNQITRRFVGMVVFDSSFFPRPVAKRRCVFSQWVGCKLKAPCKSNQITMRFVSMVVFNSSFFPWSVAKGR